MAAFGELKGFGLGNAMGNSLFNMSIRLIARNRIQLGFK